MNATLAATIPLPAILGQRAVQPSRRHCIDNFCLTSSEVERFNRFLVRLGRRQPPLDCDQLATAARELCDRSIHDAAPPCIRQRMQRAEAAALMIGDPSWVPANDAAHTAHLVLDYARGYDDLIPDWVPKVGRLDDAIVIETAWPQLIDEVASYLDFCRLRQVEAQLRGRASTEFAFSRDDWEQARRGEAALIAHQRNVRQSSYLPGASTMFQVH